MGLKQTKQQQQQQQEQEHEQEHENYKVGEEMTMTITTRVHEEEGEEGHNQSSSAMNYLVKNFFLRNLVSKKRRRLLVGGYDLDMSYITDRVLAMSFPAERMRAMYRNPLWQVKSVLNMRHHNHYKVYNLCIEETYDPSHFHGKVESYPFDDNHVPPLQMVHIFCRSVHAWLSSHPNNIAVIHCMAGKGRTGLMVCSYLVYCGMTKDEALQLYAQRRTTNNEGVSIPSQKRYVGYWESSLSFPEGPLGQPVVNLPHAPSRELIRVRLYDTVNIESIFFVISELQEIPDKLYRPAMEITKGCCRQVKKGYEQPSSPRYFLSFDEHGGAAGESTSEEPRVVVQMDTEKPIFYQKTCLEFYFNKPLHVKGDVRIIFYQKMKGGRLFYACFNTAFISKSMLQFSVRDLDKVGSRGRSICGTSFSVELLFGPANARTSFNFGDGDTTGEQGLEQH